MKKFNELGITYTPKDGKKRFAGSIMRLAAIQNITIEIHDYERNVKTEHGADRYLVSFRDKQSGAWNKFFTGSEEMKSMLDQAREYDSFPFETTIVSERYDVNKVKYFFT